MNWILTEEDYKNLNRILDLALKIESGVGDTMVNSELGIDFDNARRLLQYIYEFGETTNIGEAYTSDEFHYHFTANKDTERFKDIGGFQPEENEKESNELIEIEILKYLNKTPKEFKRLDNNSELNCDYEDIRIAVNDIGWKRKFIDVKSVYEFPEDEIKPIIAKIKLDGAKYLLEYKKTSTSNEINITGNNINFGDSQGDIHQSSESSISARNIKDKPKNKRNKIIKMIGWFIAVLAGIATIAAFLMDLF